MSFNQKLWDSLKAKGHTISDVYVQTAVGPQGGRMYVVVDGIAISFPEARALDHDVVTLTEIAEHAGRQEMSR